MSKSNYTKTPGRWYEPKRNGKQLIHDIENDIGADFKKPLYGSKELYIDSDPDELIASDYVRKHYGESYV